DRRLTGDERGATGGAALLAVPVGEVASLFGDAIDVGRAVAHNSLVVGADVEPADVVAPDDQDVWLLLVVGHCGSPLVRDQVPGTVTGFVKSVPRIRNELPCVVVRA